MKQTLIILLSIFLFIHCTTSINEPSTDKIIVKNDVDKRDSEKSITEQVEESLDELPTETEKPKSVTPKPKVEEIVKEDVNVENISDETLSTTSNTNNTYAWLTNYQAQNALVHQIPTPEGYTRVDLPKGSFGDWLRYVPLKSKGSKVYYFNGQEKYNQSVHHSVLDIDVGKRDLQQCADAVMRLKAEYHYGRKEMDKIHFNFTSGHKVAFSDWSKGRKPIIRGNKVLFSNPNGSNNTSYRNFQKYLISIFSYAGTASLSKELRRKNIQSIESGDVFIQGGFPGHAIIVMDMAKNATGQKIFLIAQSYMPAQSIHILKNLNDSTGELNGVWYKIPEGSDFDTPEWGFTTSDLKSWE